MTPINKNKFIPEADFEDYRRGKFWEELKSRAKEEAFNDHDLHKLAESYGFIEAYEATKAIEKLGLIKGYDADDRSRSPKDYWTLGDDKPDSDASQAQGASDLEGTVDKSSGVGMPDESQPEGGFRNFRLALVDVISERRTLDQKRQHPNYAPTHSKRIVNNIRRYGVSSITKLGEVITDDTLHRLRNIGPSAQRFVEAAYSRLYKI